MQVFLIFFCKYRVLITFVKIKIFNFKYAITAITYKSLLSPQLNFVQITGYRYWKGHWKWAWLAFKRRRKIYLQKLPHEKMTLLCSAQISDMMLNLCTYNIWKLVLPISVAFSIAYRDLQKIYQSLSNFI